MSLETHLSVSECRENLHFARDSVLFHDVATQDGDIRFLADRKRTTDVVGQRNSAGVDRICAKCFLDRDPLRLVGMFDRTAKPMHRASRHAVRAESQERAGVDNAAVLAELQGTVAESISIIVDV